MAAATLERREVATSSSSSNLRQSSSKPPPRRPSTAAWDISEQVLLTVTAAAQYAPTPYLGALSVSALTIFEAFQGAKNNRDSLRQLAYVACNLVLAVHDTYNELHMRAPGQVSESETFSSDPTLNKHVETLLNILNEIKDWIESHSSRPLFRRIIASRSDLNIIQDYRDQLKQVLDKFQLQSAITLRNTVSRLAAQQEDMEREAARRHESVRTALQTIQEEVQRPTPTFSESNSRYKSMDQSTRSTSISDDLFEPSSSSRLSSPPSSVSLTLPQNSLQSNKSRNPFSHSTSEYSSRSPSPSFSSHNPFSHAASKYSSRSPSPSFPRTSPDSISNNPYAFITTHSRSADEISHSYHSNSNSETENSGNVYHFTGNTFINYYGGGPRSRSMSSGLDASNVGEEFDLDDDMYGYDALTRAHSYSHSLGRGRGSTPFRGRRSNNAGFRRNRSTSSASSDFDHLFDDWVS